MSGEANFNDLIYHFKRSSPSISFAEFEGRMYTYNQLKNVEKK